MNTIPTAPLNRRLIVAVLLGGLVFLRFTVLQLFLVPLGAGAALSSLVGAFPQIVWLSEHKMPLFLVAGVMLALAGLLQWRARRDAVLACPPDRALAEACATAKDTSLIVYRVSVAIYAIGVFFAFIAPLVI